MVEHNRPAFNGNSAMKQLALVSLHTRAMPPRDSLGGGLGGGGLGSTLASAVYG